MSVADLKPFLVEHWPRIYADRIYGRPIRGASGFELYGPLALARSPHMRFLFVRPALCLQLPSDPRSLRAPLLFG
ncbi:MAG: hypothetical protein KJZ80_03665 [Hyphomicrobiaceae bacterium]|nr:hypothetical protein [Hyphomicrobiaceae bacterium]